MPPKITMGISLGILPKIPLKIHQKFLLWEYLRNSSMNFFGDSPGNSSKIPPKIPLRISLEILRNSSEIPSTIPLKFLQKSFENFSGNPQEFL